ncbi:MAG: polysaccharide biosynthesis/export family protein [Lutibacter sp.]|nr:polysaccharide biosynthesis/export family protein [Lutibacter sp.]
MTSFQGEPKSNLEIYKLNNEPYRLQVNDVVTIFIKAENKDLVTLFAQGESSGYSVDRQGNIRIPYLGDVNVLGYTEKEIREKIEIELTKYIKDTAGVFVTVKLAGINFVVTGEVGSPGTKNLAQNQVSIVDAISNAGEISQLGNKKEVVLIRKSLDGVKKYSLDLTSIDIFNSEHFYIQPNDIIYVAPLKQKSWGTGTNAFQTFSTVVTILSFVVSSVLLVKNI